MGWVRHYHGYCFHDAKDGAVFGPVQSTAIDMMHAARSIVLMMDDTKYKLAQLMNKPGDKATYTYDLGDNWYHRLTLVEVLPPEQSDGSCKVLDGAMACPPEDSLGIDDMGNHAYKEFLNKWPSASASKRKALVRGPQNAKNTGPSWQPDKFSVSECNTALAAALRSRASAADGQKGFVVPLSQAGPGALESLFGLAGPSRRAGTDLRTTVRPDGVYEQETVSTRRDPRNLAVCAECGCPNDLKYCSGCRQVRFCSKDCQKSSWKAWHKAECLAYQQQHNKKGGAASSSKS